MGETAEIGAPVRAIIADDHPLVLLAIENLMSGYPNMEVVGRAGDATELFAEVERTGCDLVLMDLYMPSGADGSGIEAVRQFRRRYPNVALVVHALISKRDRIDLIHVAVVTALADESYLGPAVRALIAEATAMQRLDFVRSVLSRRELEVFTQYASGLGVTEIAGRLGRSVKTISAQKCTAMRKLALHSDAELFRFAVEHGVVSEARVEGR
ncbi:MAG: Two-component transcriptional response regulator, LuxR family [uncultured Paraburkholderia sp.]|nr:MAG: Two-component transcriptional response regulator, LuxR family [uncultured Paraburkholderia sp.]